MSRWSLVWSVSVACGGQAEVGTAVDPPADRPIPDDRLFDDAHVLVIPTADGLSLMASDGALVLSKTWTELVGDCDLCGGEGSSADGDGLLLSFTTGGGPSSGTIARLDGAMSLDFRVQGFIFPHDAVRDPSDGTLVIPEAQANRITWIAGDGSSPTPVRSLDSLTSADFHGGTPNGIDRFDHHGRSLLVSSHRGTTATSGEITMWDITVPGAPLLLWRFPSVGALDTPHGAVFREYEGQWWLLYAHSFGDSGRGTVGLAVTGDPTVAPAYVADLVPEAPIAPFVLLRGAELTADGDLYLTDTGEHAGQTGLGAPGRVVRATMPVLAATGASGAVGEDQVFVPLVDAEVLRDDLAYPFEGWLWRPSTPF